MLYPHKYNKQLSVRDRINFKELCFVELFIILMDSVWNISHAII